MATSSENADVKPKVDVAGFFRAFGRNDSDTDSDGDEGVSMFCKACLHPYSGEEKAGTIVLRCKNCGQTDTILEEKVGNINPQQWIGDLMKNRFLQVIKEQENLKLNLVDPNFCDDDYRRVTLALEEYTNNIQAVAECMYDVVRQVNFPCLDEQLMVSVEKEAIEIEAMRATNRLIKIHKALLENSQSSYPVDLSGEAGSGQDAGVTARRSKGRRGSGKRGRSKRGPRLQREDTELEEDMKEIAEMTRKHSQTLGNTVLTLINELIDKYSLPDDLMERIEERIIRQYSEDTEEKTETPEKIQRSKKRGKQSVAQHKEKKDDIKTKDLGEAHYIAQQVTTDPKIKFAHENSNKESAEEYNKNKDKVNDGEDDFDLFACRNSKDPFEEQFYAALEEKFSIKFSDSDAILLDDDGQKDQAVPVKQVEEGTESESTSEDETCDKKRKTGRKQDLSMHFKRTSEGFMVNFYTLSAAFINELQSIKSKSLDKRKEKALAELHERIQTMKNEMEKIEDAVTEELAKAYEKKMKKSRKQKEKMDEKQQQLREAERLLNFYARTGQHDKIRAMNDELDRICGNPN